MSGPSGSELIAQAVARLRAAGVEDPARDARRLLAHAAGVEAGRLTLILPEPVEGHVAARFEALVGRRAAREPVSHLIGTRQFYGRTFEVNADVLDPRPETEMLVEAALSEPFEQVLDLGTGSGCILLTLLAEVPEARGIGVDLSDEACAVARRNAEAIGVSARAQIQHSHWFEQVQGAFDLIVANPPYIADYELEELAPEVRDYEPRMALTDEADGLEAYRAILAAAPAHMMPDARLIVEIGADQAQDVCAIAVDENLRVVAVLLDYEGKDRVVVLKQGG